MIDVVIVDDNTQFRQNIRKIFELTPDIRIIDEASDGCEFLEKLSSLKKIDVLLLDISMPVINGIDILKYIRSERPEIPVMLLSMYEEEQYVIHALKLGCRGYIPKTYSPENLIEAVYAIVKGETYVPQKLSASVTEYLAREAEGKPHERLSSWEYDMLCMFAVGKSIQEIAEALHLSIAVIDLYKARLLEKLCCRNNAEFSRYLAENHIG